MTPDTANTGDDVGDRQALSSSSSTVPRVDAPSDCVSVPELSEYLRGTASVGDATRLEQHILVCRHCAEQLEQLSQRDPFCQWLPNTGSVETQVSRITDLTASETFPMPSTPADVDLSQRTLASAAQVLSSLASSAAGPAADTNSSSRSVRAASPSAAAAAASTLELDPELPARIDRYVVRRKLGQGAFGIVAAAFDETLNRTVAIKLVPRSRFTQGQSAETFFREARIASQIVRPHVVKVYDVGETDQWVYLVTELIDGPALSQMLTGQPLPWLEASRIVADIAEALQEAHRLGLIHRDIKPGNILMAERKVPYLTDFGLAVSYDEALTESGVLTGTPLYVSPEVGAGHGHRIDGRTDIYSLGVVLYELLCGRPPFRPKKLFALLDAIQHTEPRPPRQLQETIPIEIEAICLKALSKQPADRFASASDFATALRSAIQTQSTPSAATAVAHPATNRDHRGGGKDRNRLVDLLWGAAGFSALAAVVWLVIRDREQREVIRIPVPAESSVSFETTDELAPDDRLWRPADWIVQPQATINPNDNGLAVADGPNDYRRAYDGPNCTLELRANPQPRLLEFGRVQPKATRFAIQSRVKWAPKHVLAVHALRPSLPNAPDGNRSSCLEFRWTPAGEWMLTSNDPSPPATPDTPSRRVVATGIKPIPKDFTLSLLADGDVYSIWIDSESLTTCTAPLPPLAAGQLPLIQFLAATNFNSEDRHSDFVATRNTRVWIPNAELRAPSAQPLSPPTPSASLSSTSSEAADPSTLSMNATPSPPKARVWPVVDQIDWRLPENVVPRSFPGMTVSADDEALFAIMEPEQQNHQQHDLWQRPVGTWNHRLSAEVKLEPRTSTKLFVRRVQPLPGQGWWDVPMAEFIIWGDGSWQLKRRDRPEATPWAETSFTKIAEGPAGDAGNIASTWIRMDCEAEGDLLRLWIDDRLIANVRDPVPRPSDAVIERIGILAMFEGRPDPVSPAATRLWVRSMAVSAEPTPAPGNPSESDPELSSPAAENPNPQPKTEP
jgi:hypothetical protein